jgi:hypothetical protein
MLKKDVVIKWSLEEKSTFQRIKQALVEAPVLASPDYTKDFFIFSLLPRRPLLLYYCRKMEKGMNNP